MTQKRFDIDYTNQLRFKISKNIAFYKQDSFPVEIEEVLDMPGIEKPEYLLSKMLQNPKDDIENAILVYEAFEGLSELDACQESFWAYLTHVDLFKYVQQRWEIVVSDNPPIERIKEYFFGTTKNAIGELWWNVHLTKDDERENKYELTRVLYRQSDITQNLSSSLALFPNKAAIHGILEYYLEHPEVLESAINNRNRFITQSLNRWGGAKRLMYFSKQDFKAEIEKNYETIMSINNNTDYTTLEWLQ